MNIVQLAQTNLLSAPVLAFGLGLGGAKLKSELRLPAPLPTLLSTYLLLAIGLKGGAALRESSVTDLALPALATVALGCVIPLVSFAVLRRKLGVPLAAAVSAFYGSVSAVTFTAAMTFMEEAELPVEGFLPALLALFEVPGIVVALVLAARFGQNITLGPALREVLTGRSIMLLIGGLTIGAASHPSSMERVAPLFVGLFGGVLVLFLLDLGALAGEKLGELRRGGALLPVFAIGAPLLFGPLGVVVGSMAGLGTGGAAVFGVMAASASYIAAPAAIRVALPEVEVGIPLTAALAITFPFNLVIGIPLITEIAIQLS